MTGMRASVIIVLYNSLSDLPRLLPALIDSLSPEDELILVDNASQDGCADWVERNYPNIALVRSKINLGFGGGNNLGVESARGEYLVFLNPDTDVDRDWLNALLKGFSLYPDTGMTTSKILLLDDHERINTCGNNLHISGLTLCRGMGQASGKFTAVEETDAVSGAAFAMRRDLFHQLGGYDASFFLYMEDTDLSLRVRLAGWCILHIPDSRIYHQYRLRFGPQKTYYQERNRYLMWLKTLKWGSLLALIPVFILAEMVTWGFVILRDRSHLGNKPRAYGWVIRNWNAIMAGRKQVQGLRRIKDRALLKHTTFRLEIEQVEERLLGRLLGWFFSAIFFILQKLTMLVVWW